MEDTIIALATAVGNCSISVLRLSGSKAEHIINQAFTPRRKGRYEQNTNYTAHLGDFHNGEQLIDEVLVLRMLAPFSYTGEDVYEINCHGGLWITEQVMRTCIRLGARMAEPGEFTKRAFLNGKLDLVQAEAIVDLIHARTDGAAQLALGQLKGGLSEPLSLLRQEVLDILSFIEASIDFPEDDVEDLDRSQLSAMLQSAVEKMKTLLEGSKTGKILREGLVTVIVGQPNVGKSSLLNALLKEERAIVADIPGTTRDEIRESLSIGGIMLQLVDTAGIRESQDVVERLGIERTWKSMEQADLILLVRQAGTDLSSEEEEILNQYSEQVIVLNNKMDLVNDEELNPLSPNGKWISFSVLKHQGFAALEEEIKRRVYQNKGLDKDNPLLSNWRQIGSLEKGLDSLNQAIQALNLGLPWDILSVDVRQGLQNISDITGDNVQEDLLANIFSRFCIGK